MKADKIFIKEFASKFLPEEKLIHELAGQEKFSDKDREIIKNLVGRVLEEDVGTYGDLFTLEADFANVQATNLKNGEKDKDGNPFTVEGLLANVEDIENKMISMQSMNEHVATSCGSISAINSLEMPGGFGALQQGLVDTNAIPFDWPTVDFQCMLANLAGLEQQGMQFGDQMEGLDMSFDQGGPPPDMGPPNGGMPPMGPPNGGMPPMNFPGMEGILAQIQNVTMMAEAVQSEMDLLMGYPGGTMAEKSKYMLIEEVNYAMKIHKLLEECKLKKLPTCTDDNYRAWTAQRMGILK